MASPPAPTASFLLRVLDQRVERVVRSYELMDLRSGQTLRFKSLGALRKHLAQFDADSEAKAEAASGQA
ncbi:hypothetical protein WG899_09890 [Paucibacter sp. AS339]|uniref:hypothetical protein n=1 Tax=Paucibacter hankyongi TaxID=3133434 RepID=UPI0030AD26F6